jgi:hypothetical protein
MVWVVIGPGSSDTGGGSPGVAGGESVRGGAAAVRFATAAAAAAPAAVTSVRRVIIAREYRAPAAQRGFCSISVRIPTRTAGSPDVPGLTRSPEAVTRQ